MNNTMKLSELKLGYKIIVGYIVFQIIGHVINGFNFRYQDFLFFGFYFTFQNALLIFSIGMIIVAVFKIAAIIKVPEWAFNYLFIVYSLEIINSLFNSVRWFWDSEAIVQSRLDLIPAGMTAVGYIEMMKFTGIITFLLTAIINGVILVYVYKNKEHFKKK